MSVFHPRAAAFLSLPVPPGLIFMQMRDAARYAAPGPDTPLPPGVPDPADTPAPDVFPDPFPDPQPIPPRDPIPPQPGETVPPIQA